MAGKRLITESDVRALARGAELVVTPDTIVTPAALDLAFERGVRLVRAAAGAAAGGCSCAGASASSCGGSCSKCGAWGKLLASEGTYVVVVKNGVASISKLTDQGPLPFVG
jgi:hypothetical protein